MNERLSQQQGGENNSAWPNMEETSSSPRNESPNPPTTSSMNLPAAHGTKPKSVTISLPEETSPSGALANSGGDSNDIISTPTSDSTSSFSSNTAKTTPTATLIDVDDTPTTQST